MKCHFSELLQMLLVRVHFWLFLKQITYKREIENTTLFYIFRFSHHFGSCYIWELFSWKTFLGKKNPTNKRWFKWNIYSTLFFIYLIKGNRYSVKINTIINTYCFRMSDNTGGIMIIIITKVHLQQLFLIIDSLRKMILTENTPSDMYQIK